MLKKYCPRGVLNKDPNESELYVEFFNKSVLQVLGADAPDSIRGKDFAGVVLDEYAMMNPLIWSEIIRPVLAENGGWAWFLYTPKGRNHAFDQWNNSVGWGEEWAQFMLTVNDSGLIDAKALEQAKMEMPELTYRQEFLCEFLEDATGVFKRIKQCIVGELSDPITGRMYVLGVDLAKSVDFTVLVVMDATTREVVAFERFQSTSWVEQKLRIQQIAHRYNNALTIIDSTGVGDPIVDDLRVSNISLFYEDDRPGFKFTNESKKHLIENLAIAIEQRLITFPKIDTLIQELMDYDFNILASGKITYGAPEGKHDDCVTALALACWAIRHRTRSANAIKSINRTPELITVGGYGWQDAGRGYYGW
jgi:hypothetical protein